MGPIFCMVSYDGILRNAKNPFLPSLMFRLVARSCCYIFFVCFFVLSIRLVGEELDDVLQVTKTNTLLRIADVNLLPQGAELGSE